MNNVRKDSFGNYVTAYDLMGSALNHTCSDKEPSLISDHFAEAGTMRFEIGVKCEHCGESFRIPLRKLRNTMGDPRLKSLGVSFPYMDLLKILKT